MEIGLRLSLIFRGGIYMINAINNVNQNIAPTANVLFNGSNVRTKSCNSCCGRLNHNINSGLFEITKPRNL